MDKLFAGSKHAALYSMYRFRPPSSILDRIVGFLQEKVQPPLKLALDVACGSGQSTEFLSSHFDQVVGLDISQSQISEAQKANRTPNIQYKVGSANSISADNGSAQLVAASQSCHWFDLPAFYAETRRVLVADGVLAMYWYTMPRPIYKDQSHRLQEIADRLYAVETKPYWHENRKLVDRGFDGLDFPFRDVIRETFESNVEVSLADYIGYVQTWSAYQLMRKQEPEKAKQMLATCQTQMAEIMGVDETAAKDVQLSLRFKYFLIMGRK